MANNTESRASGGFSADVHLSFATAVHVTIEGAATAGDVIEAVHAKIPEDPRHGNVLLSRGPQKFAATDEVLPERETGQALALANYGRLHAASSPLQIPTERSGITIPQIQALLGFMQGMVQLWSGTFGAESGLPLSFERFNLYHADYWILNPATAGMGGHGCSYVELVAESATAQCPGFFVSHAWLEPIVLFLRCLRRHAAVRELGQDTAYWVCAYANNQHALGHAIPADPRKSSFYLAMMLCRGVLLVLDAAATPFQRIWCCFEEAIAIENSAALYLDVAATSGDVAHILTDGLAGKEAKLLPLLGLLAKSRREEAFPAELLQRALSVRIELAESSREEDKKRILNSIACPLARTRTLDEVAVQEHERFGMVNRALAGHFAMSSLYACHAQDQDASSLLRALHADATRSALRLSLTGCKHFRDAELGALMAHLPTALLSLRLDLGHTGLTTFEVGEALCPQLQTLQLRFSGPSLREAHGIAALLGAPLLHLELWFSSLPALEDLNFSEALLKLRLDDLSLQVQACPKVPQASKQLLHNAARKLQRRDSNLQMWLCIEDAAAWMQQLRAALQQLSKVPLKRARTLTGFGDPADSEIDLSTVPTKVNEDRPFPCSHRTCQRFHANLNGYCNEHYFCDLGKSFCNTFHEALRWCELALIFFVQAAADIESKGLLLLVVLSLYPALIFSLAELSGFSVSSLSALLLALPLSSVAYASIRFDQMQRATLEFSLSSEALYSEVLQEDEIPSHTSLVFGEAGEKYPSADQMRQEFVGDLKRNYLRARQHLPSFQKTLQEVVKTVGAEGMRAQLRSMDEEFHASAGCEGAVDVLFYEIYCNGLPHVRQTWQELNRRLQSEEQRICVVALRDGFAEEGRKRRCCEVVLCIDGYFATVLLLERALASAERKLQGLCLMATTFGLMIDPRPRTGAQELKQAKTTKSLPKPHLGLAIILGLVRATSLLCSAYFALQYFLRYGGPPLQEGLPGPLRAFLRLGPHDIAQEEAEKSWLKAVALALPYAVLILVYSHDLMRCRRQGSRRLKPSQIIYERHFGVQGNCYVLKVAVMQMVTVLLQAFGKVQLLAGIVTFAMYQKIPAVSQLQDCFWIFWVFLVLNSVYPSILFIAPNARRCRYGAAVMDVVMDLGYMLNYLVIVVTAMSELRLETAVEGNFGEVWELDFSNSISPTFAFPADIMPYLAVYASLAHTCCACRSVERARELSERRAPGFLSIGTCSSRPGRLALRSLQAMYSPMLVLVLFLLLRSPDVYPGHSGDFSCFPCRCSKDPGALHRSTSSSGPQAFQEQLGHWNVTAGSCTQHADGCISSTSYPNGYPDGDQCTVQVRAGSSLVIQVEDFETEDSYDILTVNGIDYSGSGSSKGPGNIMARGNIEWRADSAPETWKRGWKICPRPPVRLESCGLAAALRQAELAISGFDSIAEAAFDPLGCHLMRLSLTNNTLTSLPSKRFRRLACLEALDLGKGQLEHLEEEVFEGLTNLRLLSLSENRLTNLSTELLRPLRNLEQLFLGGKVDELFEVIVQGNHLVSLPAFDNPQLEVLDISENELTALEDGTFAQLHRLRVLDLGQNKLRSVSSGAFVGLTSLRKLDLKQNELATLPENLFCGLASLQELDLGENWLAALPEALFHGLASLQRLDVSSNELAALPEAVFHGLASLQQLDVGWNSLEALSEALLRGMASLQKLDMNGNELAALPEALFHGLASLLELDLVGNKLAALPETLFHGLASLQRLDMGGNELTALPEALFSGLACLQNLALDSNELTLSEALFHGLASLQKLGLNFNGLTSLPEALFQGLASLQQLDLRYNELAALPEALLRNLTSLEHLFLGGNQLSWSVRSCVEAALSCDNCSRQAILILHGHPKHLIGRIPVDRAGGPGYEKIDLRQVLSPYPNVRWFDASSTAMEGTDPDLGKAVPPPLLVTDSSCFDIVCHLRGFGHLQRDIFVATELVEFDASGNLSFGQTSLRPHCAQLRCDFRRFYSQAEAQIKKGKTSIQQSLCNAMLPKVFVAYDVSCIRGSQGHGYPFLASPVRCHIIATALWTNRPSLRIARNDAGDRITVYGNGDEAQAYQNRLELIAHTALTAAGEGPETAPAHKPALILPVLGLGGNSFHPEDAVALAFRSFRRRFTQFFHSVYVCCGDRGPNYALSDFIESAVNKSAACSP
ncbi:Igfals [Symbiodinium natans]|uniref:Igfals protein n=1 Tax=Symbiodinium natans TaxID=878477 RepID=A0A812U982_9DINO|nr:Igfals [Symbiodinium natans]